MVAWWLRAMALLNGLGLVLWLAWAWPHSPALALAVAVLWLLAARLVVGLQFGLMWAVRRRAAEAVPPVGTLVRAWNAECQLSMRAYAWDMPWAEGSQADYVPGRDVGMGACCWCMAGCATAPSGPMRCTTCALLVCPALP